MQAFHFQVFKLTGSKGRVICIMPSWCHKGKTFNTNVFAAKGEILPQLGNALTL